MIDWGQIMQALSAEGALDRTASPTPPAPGSAPIDMTNYQAAMEAMNLTPQEQYLYHMHLQNLNGAGGVDNPDGSRSSLLQETVERDGKVYSIPTVWNGKIVSSEEAKKNVDQIGWDKFPSYNSDEEAQARYDQMHGFMEKDTGEYFKRRGQKGSSLQSNTQVAMAGAPPGATIGEINTRLDKLGAGRESTNIDDRRGQTEIFEKMMNFSAMPHEQPGGSRAPSPAPPPPVVKKKDWRETPIS
jgi:hypothetical protein